MENNNLRKKIKFMMLAGSSLHRYGASSDRIERALMLTAQRLEVKGEFFATPTALFACFKLDDEVEDSRLKRLEIGKVNLTKLLEIDHIIDLVILKEMTIIEGTKLIDEVIQSPIRYPNGLINITYFLISFIVSLMIGGTIYDGIAAGICSFFIGFFSQTVKLERLNSIFEGVCAFFVASFAIIITHYLHFPMHAQVITLAALIIPIPGLMITTAIGELASNNLAAGTARLTGAIIILLKLTFGVYLAHLFTRYLNLSVTQLQLVEYSFLAQLLFIPLGTLGFILNFQARLKESGWILLATISTFILRFHLHEFAGKEMSVFVAGCFLAAYSNLFAQITQKPALTILLPGIITLVPGSIGFSGLELLFEDNLLEGLNQMFKMLTIAIALVSGTYFGSLLIKPKRSL